jgi:protein dithiol oxidoreductase (disulfide-forming)
VPFLNTYLVIRRGIIRPFAKARLILERLIKLGLRCAFIPNKHRFSSSVLPRFQLQYAFRSRSILLLLAATLSGCGENISVLQPLDKRTPPQAGKDYLVITDPHSDIIAKATPQEEVQVIQFFNYACEACYEIEPELQAWLSRKPTFVKFERIPLNHPLDKSWGVFQRLYYLVSMLGQEKTLTPAIFKWVYEADSATLASKIHQFLSENGLSTQLLIDQGIANNQTILPLDAQEKSATASLQAGLAAQLTRGMQLKTLYAVEFAPSLVIGGRYKIDFRLTNTIQRFFELADYLIEKAKKGED